MSNDETVKLHSLSMDLETELIGEGRLAPKVACISLYSPFFSDCESKKNRLENPKEGIEIFKAWVNMNKGYVIGHNVTYDFVCMMREDPTVTNYIYTLYEQGRVWDTGLIERLRCLAYGWTQHPAIGKPIISSGVSLAQLVKGLLGVDLSDKKFDPNSPRYNYGRYIGVDVSKWDAESISYALDDSRYTYHVFNAQYENIKNDFLKQMISIESHKIGDLTYHAPASNNIQAKSAFALHHLACWGLRADPALVDQWKQDLEKQQEKLKRLPERAGVVVKGKKNLKKLRELIQEDLGKDTPKTEKGSVSTSTDTLKSCTHPALKALAKMGSIDKLLNTFGKTLIKASKMPLCPRWNTLVRSGRTSCRLPNLQQLPQKGGVRECFKPRKGYVYVGADYSTAELCALAQVCLNWGIDSKMAESINAGQDLHLKLASNILKITYEEAIERKKNKDPVILKYRKLAKIPNFGYPGGLAPSGLKDYAYGMGVELSIQECKDLKEAWLETWTEMTEYFKNIELSVQAGYATQHISKRRRGDIGFTDCANTFFQGLIADGAKTALYEVVKKCFTDQSSALYGSRPILFIHDEIILETPEDKASKAGDELARVMEKAMEPFLRDVKIVAEPWASKRWFKGLETVRDQNNTLVIQ